MVETKILSESLDETAPDGSEVRLLFRRPGASMAHFRLGVGKISSAVVHRSVEELWYIVSGQGEMWREDTGEESIVLLQRGVGLSIPPGVAFQFKTVGDEPLEAIAVTMPPWPGAGEASSVSGCKDWM